MEEIMKEATPPSLTVDEIQQLMKGTSTRTKEIRQEGCVGFYRTPSDSVPQEQP